MRPLSDAEMEKVNAKLVSFVGDNLKDLLDRKKLMLNNQRVFLISDSIFKACSQIGRKQLISAGSIIGKFTKTDNFKITVTAFHPLHKFGLYKVWIKHSAEMNFLYGNNALRSHIHRISESIPMNAGVFVYDQNDIPLGFGLLAVNSISYSRARGGDIIVLRQADNGEYIRTANMKTSKKQELLQKYLEKKKKQKTRDELLEQIKNLTKETGNNKLIKTKIKTRKKQSKSIDKDLFKDIGIERDCKNSHVGVVKKDVSLKGTKSLSGEIIKDSFIETNPKDPTKLNEVVEYYHQDDVKNNYNDDIELNMSDKPKLFIGNFTNILSNASNKSLSLNAEYILPLDSESFSQVIFSNRVELIQEKRSELKIFYDQFEIIQQVKRSLITLIQGDTGCGKTTQIPQFLVENGFATNGFIGITQPRRISAISISDRINTEANEKISGYKIKYENNLTDQTKIKIVTEGVLLREIQTDFLLQEYSVIILDEIHERSSNMDLLIGLLSKVVYLRYKINPLRLILMSATVDLEADSFRRILGHYSTVVLKPNSFKVNVFYESRTTENYLLETFNKVMAILNSQNSKKKKLKKLEIPYEIVNDTTAAILVFLPSKDDIYRLKSMLDDSSVGDIIVLPLHSGLAKEDQNKVYRRYIERKIVLSTNIAETSITIDDIVFVVDTGRVKYKFDNSRCVKYQIGLISQSSARQRMGRAGRTGPGVCFRIFSGETFENMIKNNIPQIKIQSINGCILFLKALGISDINSFPFISLPTKDAISDSLEYLQNLVALNSLNDITEFGIKISNFPVSPRLGKILCMNGIENIFSELCVIVAMLSVGFELKRTSQTEYYFNQKSDFVVFLKIFKDFICSSKRLSFCKKMAIGFNSMLEIEKLSKYLLRIGGKNTSLHILLSEDRIDNICKTIYYSYSDHLSISSGNDYWYDGGDVLVSKDSIIVNKERLVFDHLICGEKNAYMKFITKIDDKWFE